MSIASRLKVLAEIGRLLAYRPIETKRRAQRRLLLSAEVVKSLNDPDSAVNILSQRGSVFAGFTRWTLGEWVHADGARCFLRRLAPPPPEIWEMRITEPFVQIRIFGRFAEQDTLVLTALHTRGLLGSKGSAAWKQAMTDCERWWDSNLPGLAPLSGTTLGEVRNGEP